MSHSVSLVTNTSSGIKKQKQAKLHTILQKKPTVFSVFYENEDVTPKPLNCDIAERDKVITVYDSTGTQRTRSHLDTLTAFQASSTIKFFSKIQQGGPAAGGQPESTGGYKSYITIYEDDVIIEPEYKSASEESVHSQTQEIMTTKGGKFVPMVKEVTVTLVETPTFYILELPSSTVLKDSKEARRVERDNQLYDFLTSEKGRNRKVVHAEVQTVPVLLKSRETYAVNINTRHNEAFASMWDMYDTYKSLEKQDTEGEIEFYTFTDDNIELDPYSDDQETFEEKECKKLVANRRFFDAVTVIERLLANNAYNEEQKRFRGLSDPDPFREDIEYNYRLKLLWTFSNAQTDGRCVTSMSYCHANDDIYAVGYGKFYFTDKTTGMVMLWNIKNPVQPERVYQFDDPVTSVHFSKQNFNLLAIGFYNGRVLIIDVSKHSVNVINSIKYPETPCVEPIWRVLFYSKDEYHVGKEHLVSICQDGRILKLWPTDSISLRSLHYMRVSRGEGKLKGLQRMRRCQPAGIPISRYSAALVIRNHPQDEQIYYIATNEGVIHKCSVNYHHQHLDEFLAHDGPCYQMKFSPFCDRIFLTCGDDWYVRIWAEGINEPIIELTKTKQSVQGAEWSPTHSTIIASICGSEIYLWDLQRKTYQPQSITENPVHARNTIVHFTNSGRCLVVGDIEGNVHVYSLEDMPFPAYFQDALLRDALYRALVTRPNLKRKLKKFGDLTFQHEDLYNIT